MSHENIIVLPDWLANPRSLASAGSGQILRLAVDWLDAAGEPIGEPEVVLNVKDFPVEAPAADGSFRWSIAPAPLSIRATPPNGTLTLRVSSDDGTVADIALADATLMRQRPLDDEPMILGSQDSPWRLALVAERFDTPTAFFAAAREFWEFLTDMEPFTTLDRDGRLGAVALFWRSDPVRGHLGASDDKLVDRRLFGVDALVIEAVRSTRLRATKTIVLINSALRAGAGGFGNERPSWTTIANEGAERWTSVALHELGHSFGLADEYSTEWSGDTNPLTLEPNITRQPDCNRCEWQRLVNVDREKVPTVSNGEETDLPHTAVGTFEGARYRSRGRYRPSPDCLMRTTGRQFCRVCAAHIDRSIRAS